MRCGAAMRPVSGSPWELLVAEAHTVAVVPARGGSRGLPGKNVRPLLGRPLLAHSLACAALVPSISRVVVSTDDPAIAAVAVGEGGEVPFLRPAELARDDTPMAAVVRHAVEWLTSVGAVPDHVVLLDPTSPVRDPAMIERAIAQLAGDPSLDGIVSISQPTFRPSWVGVTPVGDRLQRVSPEGAGVTRRQDAAPFWRINGNFYVWRTSFAARLATSWFDEGVHAGFEIPERYAFSIDDRFEFDVVEAVLEKGLVVLPWMNR